MKFLDLTHESLTPNQVKLAILLSFLLIGSAILRSYDPLMDAALGDWRATHWLFNYDIEFVKRGLIGELLRQFGVDVDRQLIVFLSGILLFILISVLFTVFFKLFFHGEPYVGLWLLFLMVVSHSATLQHFAFDMGRFDAFGLLLTLLCMLAVVKTSGYIRVFIITFFMSLSILIHEATLFMYVPLVLAFWWYYDAGKNSVFIRDILLSTAVLSVVTAIVYRTGNFSSMPLDNHLDMLREAYGRWVSKSSLQVLHATGFKDNLQLTWKNGFNYKRLSHHVLMLVFILIPLGCLLYRVGKVVRDELATRDLVLMLASFSPLTLYPVAHDHFRWWALSITNFFVVVAILIYRNDRFRSSCASSIFVERRRVYGIIALSLILGPLGVIESFSVKLAEKKLGLEAYPPLFVPGHPDYKPDAP